MPKEKPEKILLSWSEFLEIFALIEADKTFVSFDFTNVILPDDDTKIVDEKSAFWKLVTYRFCRIIRENLLLKQIDFSDSNLIELLLQYGNFLEHLDCCLLNKWTTHTEPFIILGIDKFPELTQLMQAHQNLINEKNEAIKVANLKQKIHITLDNSNFTSTDLNDILALMNTINNPKNNVTPTVTVVKSSAFFPMDLSSSSSNTPALSSQKSLDDETAETVETSPRPNTH